MNNNYIHVEIPPDQCTSLGKAVLFRLAYLAQQPQSKERDAEVKDLQSFGRVVIDKIEKLE